MGAGKTQFTNGLARATGIKDNVVSPTFNIELDYENKFPKIKLAHIDAWRMSSDKELVKLGFAKKIKEKSVIAIEWAEKVADVIRKYDEEAIIIWIKIKYPSTNSGLKNERVISWGAM
jgi:tRNA threonylcarbamoyladenosine biosynthesis protein TsaE